MDPKLPAEPGAASEIKRNNPLLIRTVKRVSKRHLREADAAGLSRLPTLLFSKANT